MVIGERIPPLLVPDSLDFLSFDTFGDLYLGSKQQRLVMKFELDDRGFDPHEVILAAVVEETAGGRQGVPRMRLQAWKKNDF